MRRGSVFKNEENCQNISDSLTVTDEQKENQVLVGQ